MYSLFSSFSGKSKDMGKKTFGAGTGETYKSASIKLQLGSQRWEQHRPWAKANFPCRAGESSGTEQNIPKKSRIRILQLFCLHSV
jgi:hypothetical protein